MDVEGLGRDKVGAGGVRYGLEANEEGSDRPLDGSPSRWEAAAVVPAIAEDTAVAAEC